jgi:hypothetical protein
MALTLISSAFANGGLIPPQTHATARIGRH